MGDSDDDGDYKRRDKFRSERRGYDGGGGGGGGGAGADQGGAGGGGRRDDWSGGRREYGRGGGAAHGGGSGGGWGGRDNRGGGRYDNGGGGGGGYGGRRDRYGSPPRRHEMSPPPKRMRGADWGGRDDYGRDHGPYGGGGGGRGDDFEPRHRFRGGGGGGGDRGGGGGGGSSQDDGSQPLMMSFKAFLGTQDDSISDEDAIKKYAEYKLEFKRQQLNEFFVHHKDEEWFKLKYHPEESVKRREELRSALLKRVKVFQDFWGKKLFEEVTVDADKSDQLVKILDSVVIMLEGGDENDLKVLDEEILGDEEEEKEKESSNKDIDDKSGSKKEEGGAEHKEMKMDISDEQLELQKKAKEYLEAKGQQQGEGAEGGEARGKKRKRKRTKEYDDESSGSGSESSDNEEEEEELPPGANKKEEEEGVEKPASENGEKKEDNGVNEGDHEEKKEEEKDGEDDDKAKGEGGKAEKESQDDADGEEGTRKPRPLHKTASIFLRNLAPTITKQEVEAMCRRYPGFLRAAISDPQPDRRWFRRGWITFEREVKIKEICFGLNNIRLRDCELGPIVNRDLTRRVRTVNGVTVDKKVVRNDIRLAAKVISNLDRRWELWQPEKEAGNEGDKKEGENDKKDCNNASDSFGISSSNPVLENITDYLIEEASAEEEELLGKNSELEDGEEGEEGNSVSRDEELIRVLDRMLLYLRIVHSVDFYNHSEYPNEDEMPNRCGLIHARAAPTTSNVTQADLDDYCSAFEKKMGSFLQPKTTLKDDDANKLGMKSEDDEVEKFVQANTQELGKDKWLCPLSGKKFKGPDFVRKHIFNKHGEKVEEVKKEVQYYNNYLRDPKRPENPQPRGGGQGGMGMGGPGGPSPHRMMRDGPHMHHGGPPDRGHRYQYSGYPREATSYPVYDDRGRDRGFGGGGYGDRGYRGRDRGGYGYGGPPRGGGRFDPYGGGPPGGGRPIITYRDLDAPRDGDEF